ncbi:MAG: hypothetical protein ACK521_10045 [bacterium]|jgi:actin-like ATPase involved in cell morphogenesis
MRKEIEPLLKQMVPELENDFMHRMIAFSLSGTSIVDLKHYKNKKAKLACGLQSDSLTSFLCTSILQQRKFRRSLSKDYNDNRSSLKSISIRQD